MRHARKKPAIVKNLPQPALIHIEAIGADGDGYGYHEDKLWYVPYTMAGDMVHAKAVKSMKSGYLAEAQSWEKQAEHAQPICPLFTQCGGCKLQHLPKENYQDFKQQQVLQILERQNIQIGQMDEYCFLPAATRRRVTFAVSPDYQLSFHHLHSHQLTKVNRCPLLTNMLNDALPVIQKWLYQYGKLIGKGAQIHLCQMNKLEMTIITQKSLPLDAIKAFIELQNVPNLGRLCWRDNNLHLSEVIWQDADCFLQYGDVAVAAPIMPFLQASLEGEQFLQRKILEYMKDSSKIIELFCGLGTFSFPLALQGHMVDAYDVAEDAIIAAQNAARQHSTLTNRLKYIQRDLFKQPLLPTELKDAAILLDPPRAGAIDSIMQIVRSKVQDIVMVSCNPKSFSRDVALLQDAGFVLEKLSLLDQFTYAPHMELVAKLSKQG